MSWRRAGHDSSAVPHRPLTMLFRQPQDGVDASVTDQPGPARRIAGPAVQGEPLDARLTGGTRSLMRRVLGLNVAVPTARRAVRASIVPRPQVA